VVRWSGVNNKNNTLIIAKRPTQQLRSTNVVYLLYRVLKKKVTGFKVYSTH